ncbi:MAG: GNAT superfamily N-acetyltransferase [Ascidiaceihabitans sp.]|jgi:GNAT superfamily N-acetyltransferase
MIGNDALQVRPLMESDQDSWAALWTAYLAFYKTSVPAQTFDVYFQRLLGNDPQDFNCIVAVKDGQLVGFTHYLFHRHGWKVENTCYLQDLYANHDVRGLGIGRALIEAVYAAADTAGAPSVYWLTQDDNAEARKLYDRIGTLTNFIKYGRT